MAGFHVIVEVRRGVYPLGALERLHETFGWSNDHVYSDYDSAIQGLFEYSTVTNSLYVSAERRGLAFAPSEDHYNHPDSDFNEYTPVTRMQLYRLLDDAGVSR